MGGGGGGGGGGAPTGVAAPTGSSANGVLWGDRRFTMIVEDHHLIQNTGLSNKFSQYSRGGLAQVFIPESLERTFQNPKSGSGGSWRCLRRDLRSPALPLPWGPALPLPWGPALPLPWGPCGPL